METRSGYKISKKDVEIINDLKRVARKWGKYNSRLWLFSGSSSLHVMLDDEEKTGQPKIDKDLGVNASNIITEIKIMNDGGDWGNEVH